MSHQVSYDANIGEIPWTEGHHGLAIVNGYSVTGTRSFRLRGTGTQYLTAPFVTSTSTPSVGFWVRMANGRLFDPSRTNAYMEVQFITTSGHHVSAKWNNQAFGWDLYVQDTKVATGTDSGIHTPQMCNIRFYGTIDSTNGDLTLKFNGVYTTSFSGNTLPSGSDTTVESMKIICNTSAVMNEDYLFVSSISMWDGGADCSDRRCYVKMVNGDNSVQWDRSTGTENYALLDEVPPSDDDYVITDTNGAIDKLDVENVTESLDNCSVVSFVRAAKTTASTQQLKHGIESSGSTDVKTFDLNVEQRYYFYAVEKNPNGDVAWTQTTLNAMLVRKEAVI